jgi:plastocyanin
MADDFDEPQTSEEPTETVLPEINIDSFISFPKGATLKFFVNESCKNHNIIMDHDGDYEPMDTVFHGGALTATATTGGRYFVDCSDVTPPTLNNSEQGIIFIYDVDGVGMITYSDDKTQVDEKATNLVIDGQPVKFIEKNKDYSTFELPQNLTDQSTATVILYDNSGNRVAINGIIKRIPRTSHTFQVVDSDSHYLKLKVNFKNPGIVHIVNALLVTPFESKSSNYVLVVDPVANTVEVRFNSGVSLETGVTKFVFGFKIDTEYSSGPEQFREDEIDVPLDVFQYSPSAVDASSVKLSEDGKSILISWSGVHAPKFVSSTEKYLGKITSYAISIQREINETTSVLTDFGELQQTLSQAAYYDSQSHSITYKIPESDESALYTVNLNVQTDNGIISTLELGKLASKPKPSTMLTATAPYVITNVLLGDQTSLIDTTGLVSFSTPAVLLSYPFYSSVSIETKPSVEYGEFTDKEVYTATISSNVPDIVTSTAEVIFGGTFAWEISPTVNGSPLSDILINGISMKSADPEGFSNALSTNQLTVNDVYFDLDIRLIYSPKEAKIGIVLGKGGTISPQMPTATVGSTVHFMITPSTNYTVSDIKINGKSIAPSRDFDITVQGDTTIEVNFKRTNTVLVLKVGDPFMMVNEENKVMLDSPPIIKNGRTLLPIRAVAEALGAQVSWESSSKKVTITKANTTIEMWIGKSTALVNSKQTYIDSQNPKVVPEIINGRTMLPVRFVAESLGANVNWDDKNKVITIVQPIS